MKRANAGKRSIGAAVYGFEYASNRTLKAFQLWLIGNPYAVMTLSRRLTRFL